MHNTDAGFKVFVSIWEQNILESFEIIEFSRMMVFTHFYVLLKNHMVFSKYDFFHMEVRH